MVNVAGRIIMINSSVHAELRMIRSQEMLQGFVVYRK